MDENKENKTQEKRKSGNNVANDIRFLKKQCFWLNKMVNSLLGNGDEEYAPVVKIHVGSFEDGKNTRKPAKSYESDTCYDICAHFPETEEGWAAAIAKNEKQKERMEDIKKNLTADGSLIVHPQETVIVPTNISLELPKMFECQCRPRSGLTSVGVSIGWGTVDEGYRGDLGIILTNVSKQDYEIKQNSRIAQLAFVRKDFVRIEYCDGESNVSATKRGAGGFGSTGV